MDWTGFMVFLLVMGLLVSYGLLPYLKQRRLAHDGVDSPPVESTTTNDRPALASPAGIAGGLSRETIAGTPPPATPWFPLLVDQATHIMIVGETGAGKSTVAHALLVARARRERLLIIDPHSSPTTWGGLVAVGLGRDYTAIGAAFVALEAELTARFQQLATGKPHGEPLTIVIDEYPTIAANCKQAAPAFKALAREGRKVDMRMVILTQDAQVKTLGIEGEGAVRENFSRLLLGSFAVKECSELAGRVYAAALDYKGEIRPIETRACLDLKGVLISPARLWASSRLAPPPAPDVWLSGELAPPEMSVSIQNPPPPAPGPQWSVDHVKVAAWIGAEPRISNREIARRLWPEKSSGGDNAVKAKMLREAVEALGVSPVSLLAEAVNGDNVGDVAGDEHLTGGKKGLQP